MSKGAQRTTITQGTYHLFVGNLIATVLVSVTSIFVGRVLGPDEFGLYTIALILPTYLYLLLRFGLSSTITRHAAKYLSEGNERKAISFSYGVSILHAAVGVLAVALLIPFSGTVSSFILQRPELSSGILIPVAMFAVVGQIMFNNGSAAFVGLSEFRKSAVLNVIMGVAKFGSTVSLVLLGYSVVGAVAGYTLGFVAAGVVAIAILLRMNTRVKPSQLMEDISTSIKYAPPIWLAQVLVAFLPPFQTTILAFTVSNQEIGWYAAAVNIGSLVTLFTLPVTTSLLTLFSKTEPKERIDTYNLSVRYTALLVTPVTMFVMALSTPLAIAIYGHAYLLAGGYLLLLAAGNLVAGLGNISWNMFLLGIGETRKAFFATAVGTLVSVVSSLVLVRYEGVYGVLIGTILGNIILLIVGSKYASDLLETKPRTWAVWRIYLSSALSALVVYSISLLGLNPFLTVILGGVIFLLILFPIMAKTGALGSDDMLMIKVQFKDVKLMNFLLKIATRYFDIFNR